MKGHGIRWQHRGPFHLGAGRRERRRGGVIAYGTDGVRHGLRDRRCAVRPAVVRSSARDATARRRCGDRGQRRGGVLRSRQPVRRGAGLRPGRGLRLPHRLQDRRRGMRAGVDRAGRREFRTSGGGSPSDLRTPAPGARGLPALLRAAPMRSVLERAAARLRLAEGRGRRGGPHRGRTAPPTGGTGSVSSRRGGGTSLHPVPACRRRRSTTQRSTWPPIASTRSRSIADRRAPSVTRPGWDLRIRAHVGVSPPSATASCSRAPRRRPRSSRDAAQAPAPARRSGPGGPGAV
jgi:hypothetical protein